MAELGLAAGTIVTRNEEERIVAGAGTIAVVPAWRFLPDLSESTE
jgi:predicted AAA+ superfamily ATPase